MTSTDDNNKAGLKGAVYSFMVPVARFLIRAGLNCGEFIELAQLAYVAVASKEYGIRGRDTNTSRVSAMTGISRKDIKRLQKFAHLYNDDQRSRLSPLGDILHCWYTDKIFTDELGSPKPLDLMGDGNSFEALVRMVSSDLPVLAVKKELEKYGAIDDLQDGRVLPVRRDLIPNDANGKLISSLLFNFQGLAATIAHNSDPERGNNPGRIERFVYSPWLTDSEKDIAADQMRALITDFSHEIDNAFERVKLDHDDSVNRSRIGVGVYFYMDED